jgi:sulfite reductase alpha subunit-like flavoprotein
MRSLHVPVLYGSQTGNSELAAQNLSSNLVSLSTSKITITSEATQLDDFLEIQRAPWVPLIIIICSSYGVGQAPIGAWKFREMCDLINNGSETNQFQGVTYAMMGLGDSKYTTFFNNPKAIDNAMTKAGAIRVGELCKADASKDQQRIIEDWSTSILSELKKVICEMEVNSDEDWEKIDGVMSTVRSKTHALCRQIYDEWDKKDERSPFNLFFVILILAVLVKVAKDRF